MSAPSGAQNNFWRGGTTKPLVERICETCGDAFRISENAIRKGGGKRCSKKCGGRIVDRTPEGTRRRFMACVEKTDGCWLWTAGKFSEGYGAFKVDGKSRHAHRVAWELFEGPIPEGLDVLHECDVRACVRIGPGHLHLGTHQDNMRERDERGRTARGDRAGPRKRRERRPRGERHHAAKLTEGDVREIRARWASGGMTKAALGVEFGVTPQAIGNIVSRKGWRHVA